MLLIMCRQFDRSGFLQEVEINIDKEAYFAISHVWGSAEWVDRSAIPSISHKVYASPHKLAFISDCLPKLVGTTPFWMDILCVDQTRKEAKAAIVGHIPRIYQQAKKTLAVRDGDGPRACCLEALKNANDWLEQGRLEFTKHAWDKHHKEQLAESYLSRLWPLQEIISSNTITFVNCGLQTHTFEREQRYDVYRSILDSTKFNDDLYALADTWLEDVDVINASRTGSTNVNSFALAFLFEGTVSRSSRSGNTNLLMAEESKFKFWFSNSSRTTTDPKDFILAIFSRYNWYSRPVSMNEMSFAQLFVDCYRQAKRSGQGFSAKFLHSMTSKPYGSSDDWFPSLDVPTPATLGDFMQLLGSFQGNQQFSHGFVVNNVQVRSATAFLNLSEALDIVKDLMRFSRNRWGLSHSSGELSKFGAWPSLQTSTETLFQAIKGIIPNARDFQWRVDGGPLDMYYQVMVSSWNERAQRLDLSFSSSGRYENTRSIVVWPRPTGSTRGLHRGLDVLRKMATFQGSTIL
jgi:Heterokaryon incompatibility protein (HET)